MKHWYAIFGSRVSNINLVANEILSVLGGSLEIRDSSYIGEYGKLKVKLSHDLVESEIMIRANIDVQFGGFEEPEYPDIPVLIYASRIADIDGLQQRLASMELEKISLRQV
ncbi:hypothetical protein [Deinococcus sp.]|uniref:hypothetical protein n=1 Tax=Deinococcus sp. TaxID=47478 RepID=UPI003C7C2C0F